MNKTSDNNNKIFGRRPVLKYAVLALIVLTAAIVVVQTVPGDSGNSSAANVAIDLGSPISTTGITWDGTSTLTFDTGANGNVYSFTQSGSLSVNRTMVFQSDVNTTVVINNINITGGMQLQSNSTLKLLLAGSSNISGSITTDPTASITIDDANKAGDTAGKLTVTASNINNAGIGGDYSNAGGFIVIGGGDLTVTGGTYCAGVGGGPSGGTITVNGGKLKTTGGEYGAGIGGGYGGNGGIITINNGTVDSTGGYYGAGIGGGYGGTGGTIIINNGTVASTGDFFGAGIGGGWTGGGGIITINGGDVTAGNSGNYGAGIGGGSAGPGGTITINGGTVTAIGSSDEGGGAGIGCGFSDTRGASLRIGSAATVTAYSVGSLPAITAADISGNGYFVNALFSTAPSSGDSFIFVYVNGNPDAFVAAMDLPAGYSSFAFALPGLTSANYSIYLLNSKGNIPILRDSDGSSDIFSIRTLDGYNDYNDAAGDGVLPVKLSSSVFVEVTDITGVPSSATVGKALSLTGTAAPSGATNKDITWTLKDAGDTGATLNGSSLTATDVGTVIVTASVADGKVASSPFTKDFTITVKEAGSGGGSGYGLWTGIVLVIVVLLVLGMLYLHRKGVV